MGSPRSKSHASACIFCHQDYEPGQTPVIMSGDLSAHTRCFDENQSKPLSTYVPIQESVTRIVQVLSGYPNVSNKVKPLVGLELEYTPEQVFRICLAMVTNSASSTPDVTWENILDDSKWFNLNMWEELLLEAMLLLCASANDYKELVQAFKELERVCKSFC